MCRLPEGFPSGQRDQTVNLTRELRWFESTPLHHKGLIFKGKIQGSRGPAASRSAVKGTLADRDREMSGGFGLTGAGEFRLKQAAPVQRDGYGGLRRVTAGIVQW